MIIIMIEVFPKHNYVFLYDSLALGFLFKWFTRISEQWSVLIDLGKGKGDLKCFIDW